MPYAWINDCQGEKMEWEKEQKFQKREKCDILLILCPLRKGSGWVYHSEMQYHEGQDEGTINGKE